MKRISCLSLLLTIAPAMTPLQSHADPAASEVPETARKLAETAVAEHAKAQVDLLAELVRYRTVHVEGMANADNPEFKAFKEHLRRIADEFGLDYADHGAVAVIGLGDAKQRLGVVTHGDVQPADASKWQKSPYELDTESEPGRLIARGTEDDKAAIATALYAMKTLQDSGVNLERRIELIVALTEESDWDPFLKFLENNPPPQMNIGIDASYPVVVAEKGWGSVLLEFSDEAGASDTRADNAGVNVTKFTGGAFISQVPEDAEIGIADADDALEKRIRERAAEDNSDVKYDIRRESEDLVIRALGKSAHSSEPEAGLNALTHAAALLRDENLRGNAAGHAIEFVNALLGTDMYGRNFGNTAYRHPFMGPLTMNLSTVKQENGVTEVAINTRAPAGKSAAELETEIRSAISDWSKSNNIAVPKPDISLNDAYYPEQAPQVEPLLAVFRHYTGIEDAKPTSIGGGTNARLLPNAVNFGPSMPDRAYTGHSEHEYITRKQMTLNLRMYTAMLAWLATAENPEE